MPNFLYRQEEKQKGGCWSQNYCIRRKSFQYTGPVSKISNIIPKINLKRAKCLETSVTNYGGGKGIFDSRICGIYSLESLGCMRILLIGTPNVAAYPQSTELSFP